MDIERIRDLTLQDGSFVSAASGLVRAGEHLHVVADDEHHLASFRTGDFAPAGLLRLLHGTLPREKTERKKEKPDFEALALLPPAENFAHGALLAIGSGSRPNRRRGAVVQLAADGAAIEATAVDLTALLAPLDHLFAETNMEGAVVASQTLLLFQRGKGASNAVVAYPLAEALAAFSSPRGGSLSPEVTFLDLGSIDGVPLGLTDASVLSDGRIVFSAVAEDTPNAYDDGPMAGAAIGTMTPDFKIIRTETVKPAVKIEGIAATLEGSEIRLVMVTDADDPAVPAAFYAAALPG